MKKIFFLFLICSLFVSCESKVTCNDTPDLTPNELSWLPYTNGQMLIYQNDTGAIDTGYAQVYFSMEGCNTDDNGCNHCFQLGTNNITNFKPISLGEFIITVAHYDQWFPNNINSATFSSGYIHDYTPQNNVILNGKTYNNVYEIGNTNYNKVYYNKQYGIIAFPASNTGMKWVRIN